MGTDGSSGLTSVLPDVTESIVISKGTRSSLSSLSLLKESNCAHLWVSHTIFSGFPITNLSLRTVFATEMLVADVEHVTLPEASSRVSMSGESQSGAMLEGNLEQGDPRSRPPRSKFVPPLPETTKEILNPRKAAGTQSNARKPCHLLARDLDTSAGDTYDSGRLSANRPKETYLCEEIRDGGGLHELAAWRLVF